MIQRLEIAGVHTSVDDKLKSYVTKKIGKLDKYLPRHCRQSAHAEIKFKQNKATKSRKLFYVCEVVMYLPGEVLQAADETLNSYAAVDIVEAKLKHQLIKYKELHAPPKLHRRALARLKRQTVNI